MLDAGVRPDPDASGAISKALPPVWECVCRLTAADARPTRGTSCGTCPTAHPPSRPTAATSASPPPRGPTAGSGALASRRGPTAPSLTPPPPSCCATASPTRPASRSRGTSPSASTASSDRTAAHLGLAQSTVSGYLSCLRDGGLVTARAEGRASLYSLARPKLLDLLATDGRFVEATGEAVALCPNSGQDAGR